MSQDTAGLATELRALYPAFEGLDAARFAALLEHAQQMPAVEHGLECRIAQVPERGIERPQLARQVLRFLWCHGIPERPAMCG